MFISYSWSTEDHQAWVIRLATQLREAGVDVILDKWDLREGQDAHAFMERMVSDPEIKKVVLICDRVYAEKANTRRGGVGTETQIITPELYAKTDQTKFVAVIAERDESGQPYLPVFVGSRIHVDLSDAEAYGRNLEQLLRWVFDKPLHAKPDLGKVPAFIDDTPGPSLRTTVLFQRALDAVRNDRSYAQGSLEEYFERFTDNLEAFRITPDGQPGYDDQIVESVQQFLPFRNELIELVLTVARLRSGRVLAATLHRFIERLRPYEFRPASNSGWQEFHASNYRFIVHEIFLYVLASLLKYERFDEVGYLFDNRYYMPNLDRDDPMLAYHTIRHYIEAFEHRNKRLSSRRISLRADLLIERCEGTGISQAQLMQADFVVFMRASLEGQPDSMMKWWPETLLYAFRQRGPFEIFARAESREMFIRLQPILGFSGIPVEEAKKRIDAYFQSLGGQTSRLPRWEYETLNPAELMNLGKLVTR